MKNTHTTGPWTTESSKSFYVLSNGEFVANASNEANARLISAAPDLLAALEHVLNIIKAPDCPQIPDAAFTRGKILNAIRKAKGETL